MKNKILLLGGTGTLSTAVLEESRRQGFDVTIMNRGTNNACIPKDVSVVICDFRNSNELLSKFKNKKYDVVVDFLSRNSKDIDRVYPIFREKCMQYIFVSSACVYRRFKEDFPISEDSPKPNRDWSYNIEKYDTEERLKVLAKESRTNFTIVRPYITYNDKRIPFGITPSYALHRTIVERFKAGKPWFTWDEGKVITTVTHTIDFSAMMVGLFLNPKAFNQDYHITGDYSCSQIELIERFCTLLGVNPKFAKIPTSQIGMVLPEYRDMLKGDRALDAIFNNKKIKEVNPNKNFSIDIDRGLRRVIAYWQQEKSCNYDYKFDARIDRLLSKYYKVGFIHYPGAKITDRIVYYMFRYMPYRYANKIVNLLNLV